MKRNYLSCMIILCIILSGFSGCIKKNENSEDKTVQTESQQPATIVSENAVNDYYKELKNTFESENIDEIVGYINDCKITKKELVSLEIYSKYFNDKTYSERVCDLLRKKVLNSEAISLKLEPPKQKITDYFEIVTKAINSNEEGSKQISDYIDIMGITVDEYVAQNIDYMYDMYQREELYNLKGLKTAEECNDYADSLLKTAKVKFFDDNLKREFEKMI